MRILMVPHAYAPSVGGVERAVQQLARFLVERGHAVAVMTNAHLGAPEHEIVGGVPIWRIPFVGGGRANALRCYSTWPSAMRRIQHITRQFKPDIVHMHVTSINSRYAEHAAHCGNCPLMITTHGSFDRDINRSGLQYEERLCNAASALTHCSQAALEQFALKHPGLRQKSQVIYNGISVSDFTFSPTASVSTRTVVFIGRLHAQKGVDVLLEAWKLMDGGSARLIVAGDGEERLKLHTECTNRRLEHVEWVGVLPYEKVIALMMSATVFVLPSRDEGFPMSILEAMAAARPIAATSVGGIPEQITDGIHGLLTPPGDPVALADALRKLLSQDSLARRLGEQARQRAADLFDWSQIVQQYEDVYRWIT